MSVAYQGRAWQPHVNVATSQLLTPPMNPVPDPSSFTARRAAASNLPSFQLPPPPELPPVQKYSGLPSTGYPQMGPFSTGHLLTPPSTLPGENLNAISPTNSTGTSTGGHPAFTPYTPVGYMPPGATGSSPYELGARQAPPSMFNAASNPVFSNRPAFSPTLSSVRRQTPGNGEGAPLPPPPYDLSAPPSFPMSMSLPGTSQSAVASLPQLSAHHHQQHQHQQHQQQQQQQQHQHQQAQQQQQQPSYMSNAMYSQPTPPATLLSPTHGQQYSGTPRMSRAQPYYAGTYPASAPAHQTTFPTSITAPSPPQPSPVSTASASRLSPTSPAAHQLSLLHPTPGPAPSAAQLARSLSFSLPAMSSSVAPNLQGNHGQMPYFGGPSPGMNQLYANNTSFIRAYAGPPRPPQAQRQNDRPFKCNQCPQSFNRNHDLKRHKRIHLAVKPFPCRHCDKSFSRKDALKVCIILSSYAFPDPGNSCTEFGAEAYPGQRMRQGPARRVHRGPRRWFLVDPRAIRDHERRRRRGREPGP